MVVEAADADEAIRVREIRFDIRIVFADIDMLHGVDGMKLAAKIRDHWPPIEIILTSGRWVLAIEDLPARGLFSLKSYQQNQIVGATMRFAA